MAQFDGNSGASSDSRAATQTAMRMSGPQPQWARGVIDALAAAKRAYTPEKAMQVVQVMDHLPAVQAAIADFYQHLGEKSVNNVDLPRDTADFFLALGGQQKRQQGALVTAMAAAKRSVSDRLARIIAQRSKDKAWDVKGGLDIPR